MQSIGPRQSPRPWVLLGQALAATCLLTAPLARAQSTVKLDASVFPPQQVFRELQLQTMACGRDNSTKACDEARGLADPLLDHPRLPASCKDTLWNIRERSVVARKNSYERREALNRDATDVIALCKPAIKPVGGGSQTTSKEEEKKPGGLGGFLRGLGLGGGGGSPQR